MGSVYAALLPQPQGLKSDDGRLVVAKAVVVEWRQVQLPTFERVLLPGTYNTRKELEMAGGERVSQGERGGEGGA